jgi:diguanylate cyclase (GGDEF)-like protein/PAS domain S-box-containing protein
MSRAASATGIPPPLNPIHFQVMPPESSAGVKASSPPGTAAQGVKRLAMAERTAHIGSWIMDLPGKRLMPSDECAAILGVAAGTSITVEEMVARYMPEWRSNIVALIQDCRQDGTPFDAEMRIVAAARTPKWVRTVAEAVRDENGHIVRLQGVLQDISAQKQAQRETLRLAMRLTTTLASITEAFVTLDRQCCFTYLNQEGERLLQRSTGEMLGKAIWQGFSDDAGQRLKQPLEKSLATNHRVEFEDFYPTLNKWLEVRAYPFAEGLAVYFRDVSERRKSQEQLMLLETSISRLNDIVLIAEALPAGESAPRIVFVNDAFEQHTGYGREDVLGQTPRMLLGPEPQLRELRRMSEALLQNGQVRSELRIYRKYGSWFWIELEIVLVLAPAGQITHWVAVGRDITQRKAAEDEIHHLAFYDPLTSLPNRQLLLDRLQRALTHNARTQRQGALMFIDVDNFKVLNDTLGHHKGDQLLQKVATRLLDCVPKTDTVARLGGDEFVVMLEDLGEDPVAAAVQARVVAEKVLNLLRTPFDLDGHQHHASASMGVTAFSGLKGSVSELLKQADLAMYQAKTLGRNNACFFDPALQAAASAKAALSSDLRLGLQEQQFLLYYQPQVDRHGCINGVEALLRWQHPHRGLVEPADFIPAAEDTGLILPLGQWALETACAQLAAWAGRAETAGLSIAVNVSVRQFRHPDFVDMVMATIARTRIPPHRLKLELTESLLADRMEITIAKMGTLKALGVTLALDDFGMGYSSLSLLKRLPLDQLKIDRSFVADLLTDPNDAAISRAIITLAQSLSLGVVAEGVETQAQRDYLIGQGCEHFQGYLFSKPLPIEQLEAYLRRQAALPTFTPSAAP